MAVGAAFLTLSAAASAASFTVTGTADASGSCNGTACASLREAVDAADSAGGSNTIVLGAGTYSLSDLENAYLEVSTGSLTIEGAGSGQTIIDDSENYANSAFVVDPGADLTLDDLTVSGADDYEYGAIENYGSLTVENSALIDDQSYYDSSDVYGGAIYADGTSTTIENSNVSDDSVGYYWGYGGAIDVAAGTLTVTGSIFADDTATGEAAGIYDDSDGDLSISDSTFENDNSGYYYGAVAYFGDGTYTDENNTYVDDSTDYDGGAIYVESATSTISGDTFTDDSAYEYGGSIALEESGATTIDNDTITGGGGSYGAIYIYEPGGAININDVTVKDSAVADGSAIYAEYWEQPINISDSTFVNNNSTDGSGGALYLLPDGGDGTTTISDSTIDDNSALSYGGAIYYDGSSYSESSPLDITGSTIDGNSVSYYDDEADGGAIYFRADASPLNITDSTIANNTASYLAGGIYMASESGTLDNDTIAFNRTYPGDGGGVVYPQDFTAIENTIIADNNGGDCYDASGSSWDEGGNVDSDGSCFGAAGDVTDVNPLLAQPAQNGGGLPTVALLAGSPAIGLGVSANCPSADERGVPETTCDSGAYEYAPPANTAKPSISGSTAIGSTLSCSNGSWSGSPELSWSYQWLRNGSAIGGATSSTYTTGSADGGQSITCTVTESTSDGSASATSGAVTVAAAASPPPVTNTFSLPGKVAVKLGGGVALDFRFPNAGTLNVVAKGSERIVKGKHHHTLSGVYGSATVTETSAGLTVFTLKPTKLGHEMLNYAKLHHKKLMLTLTLTYTPVGGVPAVQTETIKVYGGWGLV